MPSDYISLNVGNIVAKRFLDTGEKRLPFLRLLPEFLLRDDQLGRISLEGYGLFPAPGINGNVSHGAFQQGVRLSGRMGRIPSPQLDKGFLQGILARRFAEHARSQSQECFRQKIRHLIYKTQKGCKCNMFPDLSLQKRPKSSDPPGFFPGGPSFLTENVRAYPLNAFLERLFGHPDRPCQLLIPAMEFFFKEGGNPYPFFSRAFAYPLPAE